MPIELICSYRTVTGFNIELSKSGHMYIVEVITPLDVLWSSKDFQDYVDAKEEYERWLSR